MLFTGSAHCQRQVAFLEYPGTSNYMLPFIETVQFEDKVIFLHTIFHDFFAIRIIFTRLLI